MTKAPSKRDLPSLGVGNAVGLAKDMDKLNIYEEIEEENGATGAESDSPKLKPKRAGGQTRLNRIDDLIDDIDIPVRSRSKPKIILTADTPRKFFKSKGVEFSTPVSTARKPNPPSTPSTPAATEATSSKSTKKSTVKKSTKGGSSSNFVIFDDTGGAPASTAKTPAKTRTTSLAASVKKSTKKTPNLTEEGPSATDEEEQPVKRSTRKRAVKRL